MKNNEIKQLEKLGFDSEQIEIYQALVSDLMKNGYTLEQAERLTIYTIQKAEEITDSLFIKDFD